jgi:hypothetical protein
MRLIRSLLLAGILCTSTLPVAAQQRGFTLAEVEELLRSGVASERVLLLVQQRCIHFVPDNAAMKGGGGRGRLRGAGGGASLDGSVHHARPQRPTRARPGGGA